VPRPEARRLKKSGPTTVNPILKRWGRALALVLAPLSLAACGVNDIPTKQEFAKAKWADVQADYQRRSDLIPNLVATVQGDAQQERSVLDDVTANRARATSVNIDASQLSDPAAFQRFQQAQDALSGSLSRLLAVSENYPDLKSNQNFLALQNELEGTENRIAIARRDYNDAVRDYNTTLRVLPTSIWAATFYHNEKPMQPFAASETAQSAPTVQFNLGGPQPAPATAAPGSAPPPRPAPATNAP
jgi:LemA protein